MVICLKSLATHIRSTGNVAILTMFSCGRPYTLPIAEVSALSQPSIYLEEKLLFVLMKHPGRFVPYKFYQDRPDSVDLSACIYRRLTPSTSRPDGAGYDKVERWKSGT